MNEIIKKITESEFEIMNVLWKSEKSLNSYEIHEQLEKQMSWKYPTVTTLLGRLVEKGALSYEKISKAYYYKPLLSELQYKKAQTDELIGKLYNGSVKNLIASLCSDKLPTEKIEELIKILESDDNG